jgi:hypothetical protein
VPISDNAPQQKSTRLPRAQCGNLFPLVEPGRLTNNDEERRQQTDKLVADLRYGFFTSAGR